MGTTCLHKPAGVKAIDCIKQEALGAEWCDKHFVTASATWGAVFVVGKSHDPESRVYVPDADGFVREIIVFKVRNAPQGQYNFCYKTMDESMGPYDCEAPLSIIAAASPLREMTDADRAADGWSPLKSAHEYRERSRKHAATKNLKRSLAPGQTVEFAEPLSFARGVSPRRIPGTLRRRDMARVRMDAPMKTAKQVRAVMNAHGRVLMVTHSADGASYGLDNGAAVSAAAAKAVQGDLFVKPSEDGLFPGMSQTWKVEG